jgi:hypothetical protein
LLTCASKHVLLRGPEGIDLDHQVPAPFSGHRFKETYDHLAPDVRWILVGGETIDGRDRVIDTCEQTLAELADTATDFLCFMTIADQEAVAVDAIGRYRSADGETSTVASCNIYEFHRRRGVLTPSIPVCW